MMKKRSHLMQYLTRLMLYVRQSSAALFIAVSILVVSPSAWAVTNRATIAAPGGITDPDSNNNAASATSLVMSKTVTSGPTATAVPNQYTIVYEIKADNSTSAAALTYNLTDTPAFSANATINSASYTKNGGSAQALSGSGPWNLATGATVAASATDTYRVSVTFTVNGTSAASTCTGSSGNGLYNAASMTVGGDTASVNACATTPRPMPRLTLRKIVSGGSAAANQWTLTATNTGTNVVALTGTTGVNGSIPAATYSLTESGGPSGYNAGTYSCVINANPAVSGNTVTLAAGDVAVCTVTNTGVPVLNMAKTLAAPGTLTVGTQ